MVPVIFLGDWVCSNCIPTDSTEIQLEMNNKAVIVLWNCPKATSANFLSFYLRWTTSNTRLVPNRKSQLLEKWQVVNCKQLWVMYCTSKTLLKWATFNAFLYNGSIFQVTSMSWVWGFGLQPRPLPSKQTSQPPSEWQAVRSFLNPRHWSLGGWRGQGHSRPSHQPLQIIIVIDKLDTP